MRGSVAKKITDGHGLQYGRPWPSLGSKAENSNMKAQSQQTD